MRVPVTIDTREQRPWHFPPYAADVAVDTLRTGDYAVRGDDGFAIERKSLDDFVGTVSSGWDRFVRELNRMSAWPARVIIVEADMEQLLFGERADGLVPPAHRHPRVGPGFLLRRLAELTLWTPSVSVLFAGRPEQGAALALAVLRRRALDIGALEVEL